MQHSKNLHSTQSKFTWYSSPGGVPAAPVYALTPVRVQFGSKQ